MRFTIDIPNELFHPNVSGSPPAAPPDSAVPLHYAATDALSGGAAPAGSGAGLAVTQSGLSAGAAEELTVPASLSGPGTVALDGGSAPR
jgi:hypothetical protein